MPNSSHDEHHGSIEAAIRETARGRAFLAEYARRLRQSDTLTLLAMVGRLERICQDLADRLIPPDKPDEGLLKYDAPMAGSSHHPLHGGVDQPSEALDRIAAIVDSLRGLDRKASASITFENTTGDHSGVASHDAVDSARHGQASASQSDDIEAKLQHWPSAPDRRAPRPEEAVLDNIAKALGGS
jgi:hypothetical protein